MDCSIFCSAYPRTEKRCKGCRMIEINADRIRAMSDEELADMFAEASVKTIEALMDAFKITDYEYNKDGFARSWMDWLRSEAHD